MIGRWAGCAEVYDGRGRFVGNGTDMRLVQDVGNGRTRIDVSFIGPMKAAGHYTILDKGDCRMYEGPINVGYAETLATGLVDANCYWAAWGLSQRFFLMMLPDGQTQLSLALLSRGDQLVYTVVGENQRVTDESPAALPMLQNGISYDLEDDPACGRGCVYLHRAGVWSGKMQVLDGGRKALGSGEYRETINLTTETSRTPRENIKMVVEIEGGFAEGKHCHELLTNGWQGWTPAGEVVGSYNLSGGRALSGQFHYLQSGLRCWRREVVSHDGTQKAALHTWYRGGERVAIQYGLLKFEAAQ